MKAHLTEYQLQKVYKYRTWLASVPVLAGMMLYWHEYENHIIIWGSAGIVFLFGLWIRIWAQQHLHYRLKAKTNLTTTGPYAIIRNPIYIGNIAICTALTIASECLWLVPITVLFDCVVFSLVVRHEEAHLTKLYGEEYIEFTRRVPRWLPNLKPAKQLQLKNEYLPASIFVEAYNLLFLVPFILKELFSR